MKGFIKHKLKEYLTYGDLKNVERNADQIFSDVNVDIDFSKHFIDRANDERNGKEIEKDELNTLFVKAHDKYKDHIKNMPIGSEKVVKDTQTAINIPIVAADTSIDKKVVVAKTIMRKPNFMSNTPILKV